VGPAGHDAPDPLIGRVLDERYRIEAAIGQGGMGAVYRGTHLMMNQRVALKVLRPHPPGAPPPAAMRRFSREARGTFALDSEHCVRVLDFAATEDGLVYMVMEHLDGRTVGDELAVDGPMAPARVAHVARQVCAALDAAHRLGFVHRDLKPDNVMLIRRGADADHVKVLDFGLAKLFDDGRKAAVFSIAPLTQKDIVFGTPDYMSPEQATGQPLEPRTDVYSLGVVMFEMLTGQLPYDGKNAMAVLAKHVKEPVPSARLARPALGIPEGLDLLVRRCMAKRREDRPASALALAAELAALEQTLAYSTAAPRVSEAVSASETMDIGQEQIARAARSSPAETGGFSAALTLPRALFEPAAETASVRPTTGAQALRRWLVAAVAAVALIGAAVGIAAVASTSSDTSGSGAESFAAAGPDPGPGPGPGFAPGSGQQAAGLGPGSGQQGDQPGSGFAPDAAPAPAPAAPAPRADPAARHLRNARAARAANNTLKQLAEADSAYRLGRGGEAAWLLGDALVKSGDIKNGCAYLRKAQRISSAKTAYQAHCAGSH
jgi:serine/threonine protein kinase